MSQATGISFHLNFRPWRTCLILTSIINWAHLKESNHHSSIATGTWLILNKCLLNYYVMNWVTTIFKALRKFEKNEAFKLVRNYILGGYSLWLQHACGRVQDILPQNIAPWHIEQLRLREFQKWHVQKSLSDLSLKQVINPPMREILSMPGRKEHTYPQRWRDTEQNLKEQALLSFCSSLPLVYAPSAITCFYKFPLFNKPSTKPPSFNYFIRSLFPYEIPCHINLILNKFVCCSPVKPSVSLFFRIERDFMRVKENFVIPNTGLIHRHRN